MVRRIVREERAFREDLNDKIKEGIEENSTLWWEIWDLINELADKTYYRKWKSNKVWDKMRKEQDG